MSRVPGTFKNRPTAPIRHPAIEARAAEKALVERGALTAEVWLVGECKVICSREPFGPPGEYRWHVSVSHDARYPTWDEIKTAVYGVELVELPAGRVFAQLLGGPTDVWVDVHKNCFHLYEIDSPFADEAAA